MYGEIRSVHHGRSGKTRLIHMHTGREHRFARGIEKGGIGASIHMRYLTARLEKNSHSINFHTNATAAVVLEG